MTLGEHEHEERLYPQVIDGDLNTGNGTHVDADPDFEDEDDDFASAFASDPSLLRDSFQGTSTSAKPLGIQQSPAFVLGRTPIPTRPIILRKISKLSTAPLTQEQTTRLLRSLTQRDIAILQSLHDYRYLSTLQIRQLFFPGLRSAQLRLEYLED